MRSYLWSPRRTTKRVLEDQWLKTTLATDDLGKIGLCLCWVASSEGPRLFSLLRLKRFYKRKRLQGALYGAVARQRRLAMKDFSTSLACFLIVLGQLCLNFDLNFNLTVDFSIELSAVLTLIGVAVLTIRK